MFKKRVVKGSRDSKRKRLADEAVESDPALPKETEKTIVAEAQIELENEEKHALYLAKEREEQEQELELRRKERTVLEQEIDDDIERKAKAKVSGFVKPISKNMKTVTITDYQPDICKDFQKTGYCGYGDSCKFLHSRDDFAGGWKLNTDWKVEGSQEKDVLKELEEIPFRCFLCKNEYLSPVVTKCNHYFCSSCFMKQMKVSTNCPICGKETEGAAKMATKLRKLLKKT